MSDSLLRKGDTHCVLVSWPNGFGAVKNKEKENSALEKRGHTGSSLGTGLSLVLQICFGVSLSIYAQKFSQWPSAVPLFWQTEVRLVEVHLILCNMYRILSLVCYYPFRVWVNFSTGDAWILSLNEQLGVCVCVCVLPPKYPLCVRGVEYCVHISCVCLSESQSVEWSESFLFIWRVNVQFCGHVVTHCEVPVVSRGSYDCALSCSPAWVSTCWSWTDWCEGAVRQHVIGQHEDDGLFASSAFSLSSTPAHRAGPHC